MKAAFGRIKLFGSAARTVLDEPLALKATVNYFQERDPSLVLAAERAMLYSDNPSVHRNMRETMKPPGFVETFRSLPLSSWPLLTNSSGPGYWHSMKAHVENNSKHDNQDILPFYFPEPHVSGRPDVIFFVKDQRQHVPFVQLKSRQVLAASDVEKGLASVSSHAIQQKMEKEQRKQRKPRQPKSTTEASDPINSNHHYCRTTAHWDIYRDDNHLPWWRYQFPSCPA